MTALEAYRLRKPLIPLAILAYGVFAIFSRPEGELELFPFFNWGLFSSAYANRTDNVVYVKAIDGRELPVARNFYDLSNEFRHAHNRDPQFFKTVDQLKYAYLRGDDEAFRRHRAIIEDRFFSEHSQVEYDLVEIEFDPVERYNSGDIRSHYVIIELIKKP